MRLLSLLLLLATACVLEGRRDGPGSGAYEVTIRHDGHGVAQDHACPLADQVLRARGERARHFGRGERNATTAPSPDPAGEEGIRADPGLAVTRLRGPRTP